MDKETLIRFATPASIFALALSITTLPFIAKASGVLQIEASARNSVYSNAAIRVKLVD